MVARRLALAALVAAPTAPAAGPPSFEGVWRAGDGDCAVGGEDATAIRIADGVLHGAGSECRMTGPMDVRGMEAALYDMECAAGDGTAFTERAMVLKAADGGIYLVWNGYAFKYAPCNAGGPVGTAGNEGGAAGPE